MVELEFDFASSLPQDEKEAIEIMIKGIQFALRRQIQYWHKNFFPRRFTWEGARLYNFRRRSPDYQKFKKRRFGENNPLVKTGATREMGKKVRIRKLKERGSKNSLVTELEASVNVPYYIIHGYAGLGKQLTKEMASVHPSEVKALEKVGIEAYEKKLKSELKKRGLRREFLR